MKGIDKNWLEYALLHSDPVPELLQKLERETYQKVLQPRMLTGPLQGRFLSLVAKLMQPKRILEIGTFTGYATLCLAEGLAEKGEIYTIDHNEELVYFYEKYFKKNHLEKQIHFCLGKAQKILPKLDGPFDLVYLDADKINYDLYFEIALPKMQKGALLIVDNVLWDGKVLGKENEKDSVTKALKEFNVKLKNDDRVQTVMLPLRDGITLSWVC